MKIFVALILGAVCGAVISGILLGVHAWLTDPPYTNSITTAEFLRGVAVLHGVIGGVLPGATIGLLIGLTKAGKLSGSIIGLVVGVFVAAYMFSNSTIDDTDFRREAILFVPGLMLVGLIVAILMNLLWHPKSKTPMDEAEGIKE